MNLEKLADNIGKKENGIYFAKTHSTISYPKEGNEDYMQIEQDSFWFDHRNNVIAEAVKKHNQAKLFFDIGGGNGFVSKRLQDEGIEVVLLEPGEMGAINAKKRGLHNIICSTLEDAKFHPHSLDSVGVFDVIEHIENEISFLKQINNFLNEDGLIYITVPAYNFLWSKEDNDAGHFRRYTLAELNGVLDECGFKVIYATYIFSILIAPILLFRAIPSKLGLNKNSSDIVRHKNEHKNRKGILNYLLKKFWKWELNRVKNSKKISFGSSCFVIAKVTTNGTRK